MLGPLSPSITHTHLIPTPWPSTHPHTHTNTQRHPRGPATRCTGPTRTRQQAGSPSARGHQPPGQHFILWRNGKEGSGGGSGGRGWKESVKQRRRRHTEAWGEEGLNFRGRTGSDVVGKVRLSMKCTCYSEDGSVVVWCGVVWLSRSCKYRVNIS